MTNSSATSVSAPIPPDLVNNTMHQAIAAGVSNNGVDIAAANKAIGANLTEIARVGAPDTALAASVGNATVTTIAQKARDVIAGTEEARKKQEFKDFMNIRQIDLAKEKSGHGAPGKMTVDRLVASSQILFAGERASAQAGKIKGLSNPAKTYIQSGKSRPLDRLAVGRFEFDRRPLAVDPEFKGVEAKPVQQMQTRHPATVGGPKQAIPTMQYTPTGLTGGPAGPF